MSKSFAGFRANPLIQKMAGAANWTVSDTQKRPINMRRYLSEKTLHLFDATTPEEVRAQLVPLSEIDADPNFTWTNRAWRLNAVVDHIICIDIEPTAPSELVSQARRLPVHYAEKSRHGGQHLLIEVPRRLIDDKTRYLFNLTVIKAPDKSFEVIFNRHFVTFTRQMLSVQNAAGWPGLSQEQIARVGRFLNRLVVMDTDNRKARERERSQARVDPIAPEDIPGPSRRLAQLLPEDFAREVQRLDAGDYDNDNSRYEYTVAAKISGKLYRVIHESSDPFIGSRLGKRPAEFTAADYAYATYSLLGQILPERQKHHEKREGLPWLLYLARKVSEYVTAQEKG